MIRLVLFDIDGTLIRTHGAGVKAFAVVFDKAFNARDGFEKLKFAGRTDLSLVREFFNVHGIEATPDNFERFFEQYAFWLDEIMLRSQSEVCAGVWEFLRDLKSLPRPPLIGLLTGNIQLGAEIKLRHLQLWDEFTMGGFADDSEDRNEIAAVARQRGSRVLGESLRGDQVVVIGDTPHDIRCARAIGAKALAVGTGGATMAELKQHKPDWLVHDLREVKAAEIIGAA